VGFGGCLVSFPNLALKTIGVSIFIMLLFVIPFFALRRQGIIEDLRLGQVLKIEGFVRKASATRYGWEEDVDIYYYLIQDLKFEVSHAAYQALIEGHYRVYCTPRTRIMVALEPVDT
jgi:hypothetical protein